MLDLSLWQTLHGLELTLRFGIIGASVSLVAMVVVSLMTKEPSAATQKMVDDVRVLAEELFLKTTLNKIILL